MLALYLKKLDLSLNDIQDLPEEEQRKIIRNKWLKLALKWHPDKNRSCVARGRFDEIKQAYNEIEKLLFEGENEYRPDFTQYFDHKEVEIPDTAFDLILQENIEREYDRLQKHFLVLDTNEKKRAFGAQYASFFNLAAALEKNRDGLNSKRVDHLYARQNEGLSDSLIRSWRELIIRLFAEEYLDDFQYRQALAAGDLFPILATRKLCSPIKYPVAVLNSITLVICQTSSYLMNLMISNVANSFKSQFEAYQQRQLTISGVAISAFKLLGLIVLISTPFYYAPIPCYLAISLPLLADLLESLACPVNKISRPLAAYIGIPAPALTIVLSVVGGIAFYALLNSLTLTNLMTFLPPAIIVFSLYNIFALGRMLYNLYKISPALGVFQGLIMLGTLLSPQPSIDLDVPINLISLFVAILTNCSMLYYLNNYLENINVEEAKKFEVLPLPNSPVPEEIQRATLLGNKTALQSHRFFNTSKEAEYLEPKDRTFWQQTQCFFGGGMKSKSQPPLFQERSLEIMTSGCSAI